MQPTFPHLRRRSARCRPRPALRLTPYCWAKLLFLRDYGDTEVGGQVYTLPLAFTLDVRLRKRTQIRNENVFRSYQRFASESRLLPGK